MSSHFDSKAAGWDDDPAKVERARHVAEAVLAAVPVPQGASLLEYGAGTGLVTQALRERVGPVVLADNSAGMREVMVQKVASGALPHAEVWELDLEHDEVPEVQCDLVVTALVLHHVRDLPRVLSGFAALLRPGGHVCIADLDREDGSFHQPDFDGHHGFDRSQLAEDLRRAGFVDVTISDCGTLEKEGRHYSYFLAAAQKPGTAAQP